MSEKIILLPENKIKLNDQSRFDYILNMVRQSKKTDQYNNRLDWFAKSELERLNKKGG